MSFPIIFSAGITLLLQVPTCSLHSNSLHSNSTITIIIFIYANSGIPATLFAFFHYRDVSYNYFLNHHYLTLFISQFQINTLIFLFRAIHSDQYCAMYDICGQRSDGKVLNCPYSSPAVKVSINIKLSTNQTLFYFYIYLLCFSIPAR